MKLPSTVSPFILTLLFVGGSMTTRSQHLPNTPVRAGTVINKVMKSTLLGDNKVGLDLNRKIKVYLPPGYNGSKTSYPVVYYCHNIFWSPEKMFEDGRLTKLLDRAFANGIVKDFIFVAADYGNSSAGSIYENSSISGRWLDFTVNELVPFIDSNYRTLKHRESRAVAGDFIGGPGSIKISHGTFRSF